VPLDLLGCWLPKLSSPGAQEHLKHGVCRRLKILARALENIFDLCPPEQEKPLEPDALCDVNINLHAFVINVHGLLDNLAWVTVFERCPTNLPKRKQVSLFSAVVQAHLRDEARAYLTTDPILGWHARYAKAYRDALAHRIPLYVPPCSLDTPAQLRYEELENEINAKIAARDVDGANAATAQQNELGKCYPVFVHSFAEPGASPPVPFHPQLIADSRTVLEVLRVVSPVALTEYEMQLKWLSLKTP
jgi:hypothetical protein